MKLITSLERSGIVIKKIGIEISEIRREGEGCEGKKEGKKRNNGVIRSDDTVNHSLDEKYKIPVRETETKNPCCSSYLYVNSLYGRFNIPLSRSHVKSTVCVSVYVSVYLSVCVCVCVHWTTISLCNTALYKCVRPGFPFRSAFCLRINPRKSSFFVRNAPRKTLSLCDTVTRYT